jgi:sphinganine-1-phosphate aldolase
MPDRPLSPHEAPASTRTKAGFPESGLGWSEIKRRMLDMQRRDVDWRRGRSGLHVYYAGDDVLEVAREAYAMFMSENALAPAAFPSLAAMEADLVGAALDLFQAPPDAAGSVTSGGTESIILAVKAARDWARERGKASDEPFEIVLPRTAHPAFDKAASLLGVRAIRVATGQDFRADAARLVNGASKRTIMIVASAPSFPYGLVDPIDEIGRFALERDLWLHVDACIGGFLAPFARKLGHHVPGFDFAVPGVRSLSADLHKYGYAAKGASLVLYCDRRFQQHQFTEVNDWPKGRYHTPTLAGTRPGGALAAAWAVMHYLGKEGYVARTSRVMRTWRRYLTGISNIPGLSPVVASDLAVVAFASRSLDIFAVADELTRRGWYVSRLAEPRAIHQLVTMAHETSVEEYLEDLAASARDVVSLSLKAASDEVVTY